MASGLQPGTCNVTPNRARSVSLMSWSSIRQMTCGMRRSIPLRARGAHGKGWHDAIEFTCEIAAPTGDARHDDLDDDSSSGPPSRRGTEVVVLTAAGQEPFDLDEAQLTEPGPNSPRV
jgi:hypothetical protein